LSIAKAVALLGFAEIFERLASSRGVKQTQLTWNKLITTNALFKMGHREGISLYSQAFSGYNMPL